MCLGFVLFSLENIMQLNGYNLASLVWAPRFAFCNKMQSEIKMQNSQRSGHLGTKFHIAKCESENATSEWLNGIFRSLRLQPFRFLKRLQVRRQRETLFQQAMRRKKLKYVSAQTKQS